MKSLGFSLMEVMIYLGLFSMIMTGALVTAYLLIDTVDQNQEFEAVYTEGVFLNKKIAWVLSNAVDAKIVGATRVEISSLDLENISLEASSSRFWIQSGGREPEQLSGPQFTIGDVWMSVSSSTPKIIEIFYNINNIPFSYRSYSQ